MGLNDVAVKGKPIVVCRMGRTPEIIHGEGARIVQSPLECFSRATEDQAEFIVVVFSGWNILVRHSVLELCRHLKNNPLTGEIPVIAVMEGLHREMMVKLQECGVALFDKYKATAPIDLNRIKDLARRRDYAVDIREEIKKLCPFLNHIDIEGDYVLTACGAYKNRMVLGGKRLHEICETLNYRLCDYFMKSGIVP